MAGVSQLGKETPPCAIPGKVIEGHVGGNRLKPAADGGAGAQLIEPFKSLKEHLLGDVLGLGLVGDKAHSGAKYHVLVIFHERFKCLRILSSVCRGDLNITLRLNPRPEATSSPDEDYYFHGAR